jgi:hypothetical protein
MTSDLLVHIDSSHPYEHAKASVIYLINRMTQYPLTHAKRKEENEIINKILTIIIITNKIYIRNKSLPEKMPNKKRITFKYFGPETRATINLFRKTYRNSIEN